MVEFEKAPILDPKERTEALLEEYMTLIRAMEADPTNVSLKEQAESLKTKIARHTANMRANDRELANALARQGEGIEPAIKSIPEIDPAWHPSTPNQNINEMMGYLEKYSQASPDKNPLESMRKKIKLIEEDLLGIRREIEESLFSKMPAQSREPYKKTMTEIEIEVANAGKDNTPDADLSALKDIFDVYSDCLSRLKALYTDIKGDISH